METEPEVQGEEDTEGRAVQPTDLTRGSPKLMAVKRGAWTRSEQRCKSSREAKSVEKQRKLAENRGKGSQFREKQRKYRKERERTVLDLSDVALSSFSVLEFSR